jgi:hypothetical protein
MCEFDEPSEESLEAEYSKLDLENLEAHVRAAEKVLKKVKEEKDKKNISVKVFLNIGGVRRNYESCRLEVVPLDKTSIRITAYDSFGFELSPRTVRLGDQFNVTINGTVSK